MEHLFEGIAQLRHWYINPNEKFELTYLSLNGALPSRKCSSKAPAKCKTSVYVLTEICLHKVNDWALGSVCSFMDERISHNRTNLGHFGR